MSTAQTGFVGAGLTAIGLLFTFGLEHEKEHLLAGIAPLALAVTLLHLAESYRIHRLGDYLRLHTWRYVNDHSGYKCSWERQHGKMTAGRLAAGTVFDGATPILFTALGVAGTMLTDAGEPWPRVGWISVGLTLAAGIILFLLTKVNRGPSDGRQACEHVKRVPVTQSHLVT